MLDSNKDNVIILKDAFSDFEYVIYIKIKALLTTIEKIIEVTEV